MARKLIVEIIADPSALNRGYAAASKSTKRFGRDVESAGRGALVASVGFRGLGRAVTYGSTAFLGGAGFIAVAKSSLEAASNLHEQLSKSDAVFGQSAAAVEAWSKTTVTSMGLAQDQALETASSLGALLRPMGLTGAEAAKQAQGLTQLGSDLASFYNTSVADALQAIQSGLTGQVRPLRRYGVLLSAARVQQEALNETGKRSAKQLTEQDKALARIAIIYHDTSLAQGDFVRTSAGMANQQRILQANVRNLQITLGEALEPALLKIVTRTNKWLENTRNQEKLQRTLNTTANTAAGAFSGLATAIDAATTAYEKFRAAGEKLPGGKGGFFDTLITGTLPAQADALWQSIHKLRNELKGVDTEATNLQSLPSFLGTSAVSQLLAGAPKRKATTTDPFADVNTRLGYQGPRRGAATEAAIRRNQYFDARIARMLDRVQDIRTLRGQIAQLRVIEGLVKARVAITKDVTRQNALGDVVADIDRRITENRGQIADKAAEAARKLKEKEQRAAKAERAAEKASLERATKRVAAINAAARAMVQRINRAGTRLRDTMRAAEQRAQYRALGLTGAGEERLPKVDVLLTRLRKLRVAIRGTDQDTRANRTFLMGAIGDLLGRHGTVTKATVSRINDFYTSVHEALDKGNKGTLRYFKHFSAEAIVDSLGAGLTGAQKRRLELALSGVGPGLTVPTAHSTAYAAGIRPGVVIHEAHFHGVQNLTQLEDEMEKRQRARAYRRRGAR
jgi:hypothetical protein